MLNTNTNSNWISHNILNRNCLHSSNKCSRNNNNWLRSCSNNNHRCNNSNNSWSHL